MKKKTKVRKKNASTKHSLSSGCSVFSNGLKVNMINVPSISEGGCGKEKKSPTDLERAIFAYLDSHGKYPRTTSALLEELGMSREGARQLKYPGMVLQVAAAYANEGDGEQRALGARDISTSTRSAASSLGVDGEGFKSDIATTEENVKAKIENEPEGKMKNKDKDSKKRKKRTKRKEKKTKNIKENMLNVKMEIDQVVRQNSKEGEVKKKDKKKRKKVKVKEKARKCKAKERAKSGKGDKVKIDSVVNKDKNSVEASSDVNEKSPEMTHTTAKTCSDESEDQECNDAFKGERRKNPASSVESSMLQPDSKRCKLRTGGEGVESSISNPSKDSSSSSDSDSVSDMASDSSSSDEEDVGAVANTKAKKDEVARKAREAALNWVPSPLTANCEIKRDKNRDSGGCKSSISVKIEEGTDGAQTLSSGTPFKRVDDHYWGNVAARDGGAMADNSYTGTFGDSGFGSKSSDKLIRVRGKDFRHEKTKKKRSFNGFSRAGGSINMKSFSTKFENTDD